MSKIIALIKRQERVSEGYGKNEIVSSSIKVLLDWVKKYYLTGSTIDSCVPGGRGSVFDC